jgi:hypothetical protein
VALYHFSGDPGIRIFEPHVAATSATRGALVWAIDDWHQAMYFFPRACFWPGDLTTPEDRTRLFGLTDARMVIAVESRWLERIRTTKLYRYTLPEAAFEPRAQDGSGHWISRETVTPVAVEPMVDLLDAVVNEGVELRLVPSLIELWKAVIQSSLAFSGTRLRNAVGWSEVDWDAIPLGVYAEPRPGDR